MTVPPSEADPMAGTVFEHADEPAFVMDPADDRIVAANDAGCRLLGYSREELLQTRIDQIHPAELPELRELLQRVLRDGRGSTIRLTCRTKGGTFLPTEISLYALELAGSLRVLGLVKDRSEHRGPAGAGGDARHPGPRRSP
jgi:two-component system, chemotaxis family, sensor kinase Cph1